MSRALAVITRATGALATIRSSVRALVALHRQPGQVRMIPIHRQDVHEWIDENGQHHRQVTREWVGIGFLQGGALGHEIRWHQEPAKRIGRE